MFHIEMSKQSYKEHWKMKFEIRNIFKLAGNLEKIISIQIPMIINIIGNNIGIVGNGFGCFGQN